MSSSRREDRFPLLFVVDVTGDSLEKPPLDPSPSIRDRNVTRGAATLISRWPHHVQSTSRLAFFTAFAIIFMSCFMVAVIFYTSDFSFGDSYGLQHPARRRAGVCNIDKEYAYESMHDGGDASALVKFMTPLPRAWEFFDDDHKIFFVLSVGDTLTAETRCAVMSAARVNDNATVYLLIFHDRALSDAEQTEVAEQEEAAFNGSVSVLYVDAMRYFNGTPLNEFWQHVADKQLKTLVARLVTLWRFGGLSLDVDVLSLKEVKHPRHKGKSASVDEAGHVMSVRYPCHAFLFQAMRVLEKMQRIKLSNDKRRLNTQAVLTVAQEIYCSKPHCRNRSGHSRKCPGFKAIPKDVVCSLDHVTEKGACVWATFTQRDVDKKHFKDMCEATLTLNQVQE